MLVIRSVWSNWSYNVAVSFWNFLLFSTKKKWFFNQNCCFFHGCKKIRFLELSSSKSADDLLLTLKKSWLATCSYFWIFFWVRFDFPQQDWNQRRTFTSIRNFSNKIASKLFKTFSMWFSIISLYAHSVK